MKSEFTFVKEATKGGHEWGLTKEMSSTLVRKAEQVAERYSLVVYILWSWKKCIRTCIHYYSIIQKSSIALKNLPCCPHSSLLPPYTMTFHCLHALPCPECHLVGIIQYVAFKDCLLCLSLQHDTVVSKPIFASQIILSNYGAWYLLFISHLLFLYIHHLLNFIYFT